MSEKNPEAALFDLPSRMQIVGSQWHLAHFSAESARVVA